jgi:DNA-binding response OmpR family regulator
MRLPNQVLHIDADEDFCRKIGTSLREAGIESCSLPTGDSWEAAIVEQDAGIVLLEIDAIPEAAKQKIVEQIRQLEGNRRVILLTQALQSTAVLATMNQGADYYFLKSEFNFTELLQAIYTIQRQRDHWHRAARVAREGASVAPESPATPVKAKGKAKSLSLGFSVTTPDQKVKFLSEPFPRYLLDHCAVSLENLMKASEYADRQRPLLGQLAIEAGFITMRQIFQIVEEQTKSRDPFGKIAVRLGLMTDEHVERLLQKQRERRPEIGTALIEIGAITSEQLTEYEAKFRAALGDEMNVHTEHPANEAAEFPANSLHNTPVLLA